MVYYHCVELCKGETHVLWYNDDVIFKGKWHKIFIVSFESDSEIIYRSLLQNFYIRFTS